MTQTETNRPFLFNFVKWYGYIISLTFLLYGGVQMILGILDRQYEEFYAYIIMLLVGIILISICFAFRDLKSWAWHGLIYMNCLIIFNAFFGLGDYLNIIPLVLSVFALVALFMPQTKQVILQHQ